MAGVQQVEHAVGEDDGAAAGAHARDERQGGVETERAPGSRLRAPGLHDVPLEAPGPSIWMPPENDQPCFGRKKPMSLTGDVTRNE